MVKLKSFNHKGTKFNFFLKMTNYEKISFAELTTYVIKNRDDIEALSFLMSKRDCNSLKYPAPITEAHRVFHTTVTLLNQDANKIFVRSKRFIALLRGLKS
ncbi:MAG: hypothetical protein WBA41_12055 [Rivularia sp. (in: cyanobacteria)]